MNVKIGRPRITRPRFPERLKETTLRKRGDSYLRKLLVHGARAVLRHAKDRDDGLSQWLNKLAARKHANVATVALANKTARIVCAFAHNETTYDPMLVASIKAS